MVSNFTIDELMTRVMPGGVLLAMIYFIYGDSLTPLLDTRLDVFYTFLFFCCAFIVGEILQTISDEMEFIIDVFFKCRRPSEVFLYKDNPVIKNEHNRSTIIEKLNLPEDKAAIFKTEYSDLPVFLGRSKKNNKVTQGIFWKLYANVSNSDEIKIANRSYLFTRVIMTESLILSILFLAKGHMYFGGICAVVFLLFLWRCRGVARGLAFKTVMLNLKE
jgi:hypothetical protein